MKNEKLQSRREFFKNAAQVALPILGIAILANSSLIVKAADTAMGCNYSCTSSCSGTCKGACSSGCTGGCYDQCYNACKNTCKGTCRKLTD